MENSWFGRETSNEFYSYIWEESKLLMHCLIKMDDGKINLLYI